MLRFAKLRLLHTQLPEMRMMKKRLQLLELQVMLLQQSMYVTTRFTPVPMVSRLLDLTLSKNKNGSSSTFLI